MTFTVLFSIVNGLILSSPPSGVVRLEGSVHVWTSSSVWYTVGRANKWSDMISKHGGSSKVLMGDYITPGHSRFEHVNK